MTDQATVLVTGGSGFIGAHIVVQALQRGFKVHTTIRSLTRSDAVRKMLLKGGATESQAASVKFFAAELLSDAGWTEACEGCKYVLHIASPIPPGAPKHENDLILPAKEGTLRALRAAKIVGTVKRVVITSSFGAIAYGHSVKRSKENPFTEDDWTDLEGQIVVPPYMKSKTIAERAAWDWIEKEGDGMELAVVNPNLVLGPLLSENVPTSIDLFSRILKGQLPGCPDLYVGVVDVRDVADLHFRALLDSKGAGQRFIATADGDSLSIKDLATILKKGLPEGKKISTRSLPDFVLKIVGFFDPAVGFTVPELGKQNPTSNTKAKRDLEWAPRSAEEAILACAKSLKEYGVV